MKCVPSKVKKSVSWVPSPPSSLKFNVDGAVRGKLGPTGIGGILRNYKVKVLFMFSKHAGVRDSYEAEVLVILEALRIFPTNF